jgi:hypothetical protein
MIEQVKEKSTIVTYYTNHPYYNKFKYRNAVLRRDKRDQHKWLVKIKTDITNVLGRNHETK